MSYRNYKKLTFKEKVKKNKSFKWFSDQKNIKEAHLIQLKQKEEAFLKIENKLKTSQKLLELHNMSSDKSFEFKAHKRQKPNWFCSIFLFKDNQKWIEQYEKIEEEKSNLEKQEQQLAHEFLESLNEKEEVLRFCYTKSPLSYSHLRSSISCVLHRTQIEIKETKYNLSIVNEKYEKLKKLQLASQRDKSIIAKVKKQSRENAALLKNKLEITKKCPYCMKNIGKTPHADHIYPLSKGGQETIENMIMVCSTCNLKKSNKSLYTFCIENGFDFNAISKRLREMDKDF